MGEKLMDKQKLANLLSILNQNLANKEELSYKKFADALSGAKITLKDVTTKCAFIHLLKNCPEGHRYHKILKKDLLDFLIKIAQSATTKNE